MVRIALAVLTTLILAGAGFGQGFVTFPYEVDQTLTTTCGGTIPIPDSTPYYLFQDINGNGPDSADTIARLCDDPPNCTRGPDGTLNWNTLGFNGRGMGIGAGRFYPEYGFASLRDLPEVNRFYIRAYYPPSAPQIVWNSGVFSPSRGYSEFDLSGWTCQPFTDPCQPTAQVFLVPTMDHGPQDISTRAVVHVTNGTSVWVGPLTRPNRLPTVSVDAGCTNCLAASNWYWHNPAWTWTTIGDVCYYTNTLRIAPGGTGGCVMLHLEFLLPVVTADLVVTPLDHEVRLTWTTHSETDVARFELQRDGDVIAAREAANTATEHTYEFTDYSVENGRTYRYILIMANLDGSRQELATAEAIPGNYPGPLNGYALHPAYPNPFNAATTLAFDVPSGGQANLRVFDLLSREVAVLARDARAVGRHSVRFDAAGLPSGIYICRLTAGGFATEQKLLLLK